MTDGTFLDALVDALDTARRATGGGGQVAAGGAPVDR